MLGDANPSSGRGAGGNPANRFEPLHYACDPDDVEDVPAPVPTQFLKDASRSLITYNDSPDVGFDASINPYRGCEHGCVYCYARPTHEYLGFSAGLDFETKILVKEDAPELLRRELASPRWKPQVLAISGVTDPYQPIERHLGLTRQCLQVLAEFRNPVMIITKSQRVTRDLDVVQELASHRAVAVFLSVTTLDGQLSRILEPRASQPAGRLAALQALREAGVPAGVLVAPVIPGLTDHEIPGILEATAAAGAQFAGYVVLRLPHAVRGLFEDWLSRHLPDKKEKVLGRIRDLRGGKLNDPNFGTRMKGQGIWADTFRDLFQLSCRQAGIQGQAPELTTKAFRRPAGDQRLLFRI
jgi:DNA repair photolyase